MKLLSRGKPMRSFPGWVAWALAAALAVGVSALLPACGGSAAGNSDASVGRQLSTLREAYDKGVITREEYERERRRIIGDW
jgi:uncharacterized membrane protein